MAVKTWESMEELISAMYAKHGPDVEVYVEEVKKELRQLAIDGCVWAAFEESKALSAGLRQRCVSFMHVFKKHRVFNPDFDAFMNFPGAFVIPKRDDDGTKMRHAEPDAVPAVTAHAIYSKTQAVKKKRRADKLIKQLKFWPDMSPAEILELYRLQDSRTEGMIASRTMLGEIVKLANQYPNVSTMREACRLADIDPEMFKFA